jgi:hypothetical protein
VSEVKVQVPPVFLEFEGARVTILEVAPYVRVDGARRYLVSCIVEVDGYRSPLFHIDAGDNEELARRLRVEIAKMRVMIAAGYTEPFTKLV